jgi:hypothetical protein
MFFYIYSCHLVLCIYSRQQQPHSFHFLTFFFFSFYSQKCSISSPPCIIIYYIPLSPTSIFLFPIGELLPHLLLLQIFLSRMGASHQPLHMLSPVHVPGTCNDNFQTSAPYSNFFSSSSIFAILFFFRLF